MLQNTQKNRFLKLSLKKNKMTNDQIKKLNRSSDVIILDESFDKLKSNLIQDMKSPPKIYSPIVIDDSCELSINDSLPKITLTYREDDKDKSIPSVNCSKELFASPEQKARPSLGGWSPAQSIICATPKHDNVPSTPKDVANESLQECSFKKIQHTQKKILDDLYGEVWRSIPTLFKTVHNNFEKMDVVSKKLQFNDDESDKENIRQEIREHKKLYLTGSDAKRKFQNETVDSEKKSKKKLYTEVYSTPEPPKLKPARVRNVNSTTKKIKGKSVTEMVQILNSDQSDIDSLAKRVENVKMTPTVENTVGRLSFMASLADDVPSWRCHPEAVQYRDNFKTLRDKLARRMFTEFNKVVFDNALDADLPIIWDTKLRSTAGTTTNRLIKNSKGDKIRSSSIKLSVKVCDRSERARDTLAHELCHAATWLIDAELRAGHGPLWNNWAKRTLRSFPELGEISRCHDMQIHYKYSYKCTKCGYSIQRHSKSIDITKKCCGYCRGTFELVVNKKNKDGVVISTPARKGEANDFAKYVKENYGTLKDGTKNHAQVMKILGEQYSAKKKNYSNNLILL